MLFVGNPCTIGAG